jgi:hypothetical protein
MESVPKFHGFSLFALFSGFFHGFSRPIKAKRLLNRIYRVLLMEVVMRQTRKLAKHVWYKAETAINNREPVFQLLEAVVLLCRVLIEAKGKFPFEMRGLVIGNEWLSFYIKPVDGYQLPESLFKISL